MNEKEKSEISESAVMSRLVSDLLQDKAKECKRLWIALLSFIGAFVVAVCIAVTGLVHMQDTINKAVLDALNTFAEVEVVGDTTTVNQDTGESGGNAIYQSGEKATYNESGDK